MVVLGGWAFLMSEVPLQARSQGHASALARDFCAACHSRASSTFRVPQPSRGVFICTTHMISAGNHDSMLKSYEWYRTFPQVRNCNLPSTAASPSRAPSSRNLPGEGYEPRAMPPVSLLARRPSTYTGPTAAATSPKAVAAVELRTSQPRTSQPTVQHPPRPALSRLRARGRVRHGGAEPKLYAQRTFSSSPGRLLIRAAGRADRPLPGCLACPLLVALVRRRRRRRRRRCSDC
ncbi:hypothetical protein T484DRAFT_2824043 [Baffinella frigidus]|nr:hypothetical protein T484DRAFT_2824043 [Cryptophyta sp. CCMP2293]